MAALIGAVPHPQVAISVKTKCHQNPNRAWKPNHIADIEAVSDDKDVEASPPLPLGIRTWPGWVRLRICGVLEVVDGKIAVVGHVPRFPRPGPGLPTIPAQPCPHPCEGRAAVRAPLG
jgi:hypothetical protein